MCVIVAVSCSSDSTLKDHPIIGNYLGSWDFIPETETRFSIEYENEGDKLVLFFSLADSFDLNVISDTEFTIDRYEQNGYSNGISGILVEDTMYIQNEVFLIGDQQNSTNLRTGTFVRQ